MRFEVETPIQQAWAKRRRLFSTDSMDSDSAQAKLAAISEQLGREIHVFETGMTSEKVMNEEPDDFYEFTAADYYRVLSTQKEDRYVMKTRKIREAEEAARRSKITKAIIRVRFPDNYTLEIKFHASETFRSLIDLLMKVVSRPDIPFYLFTTPPKRRINDMSLDFYSAGFIPGAIVYFSYDLNGGDESVASLGPYLRDEIRSLNDLNVIPEEQTEAAPAPEPEPADVKPAILVQQPKPSDKKPAMPKWFKR